MATFFVEVPDQLRLEMDNCKYINWSTVACKAFEERLRQIQTLKRLAAKSKLTQKDADEIADVINRKASKQFMEL